MNIVILGPQGSGKDTQAEKIAEKCHLEMIHMGKFLRDVAKQDTPLGKEVYHYQNVINEMVPSRILKEVLYMKIASYPREQGIMFEGVPRTMDQAQYFDEAVLESGRKIDAVINLKLSEGESIKRISIRRVCEKCKKLYILGKDLKEKENCLACGGNIIQRIDDTDEGVKKRLKVFNEETLPVIDHYRKKGNLLEINGDQSIEEVFEEILDKLNIE